MIIMTLLIMHHLAVDTSAISTAKSAALGDTKPKSRHYALRWIRVKDAAGSICYCPTSLQKADGLTKLECAVPQRNLLLFHTVQDPVFDDYDSDLEEDEDGVASYSSDHSFLEYSVFFGF